MVGWDGRGQGNAPPVDVPEGPGEPNVGIRVGEPPNYSRLNPMSPRVPWSGLRSAASTLAAPRFRGPVLPGGAPEPATVLHPDALRALQYPVIYDARPGHRFDFSYGTGEPIPAATPGGYFRDDRGRRYLYGATAQQLGVWLENRCGYCHTHYGDTLLHGSGVMVVRCSRSECRRAGRDRTTIFYGAPPAPEGGPGAEVILDPSWVGPERQ